MEKGIKGWGMLRCFGDNDWGWPPSDGSACMWVVPSDGSEGKDDNDYNYD